MNDSVMLRYFFKIALLLSILTVISCGESKPDDPLEGFKANGDEINRMSAGKLATIIARYRRLDEKDQQKVKRYVDQMRRRLAQMPESERRMTHEVNHD